MAEQELRKKYIIGKNAAHKRVEHNRARASLSDIRENGATHQLMLLAIFYY